MFGQRTHHWHLPRVSNFICKLLLNQTASRKTFQPIFFVFLFLYPLGISVHLLSPKKSSFHSRFFLLKATPCAAWHFFTKQDSNVALSDHFYLGNRDFAIPVRSGRIFSCGGGQRSRKGHIDGLLSPSRRVRLEKFNL